MTTIPPPKLTNSPASPTSISHQSSLPSPPFVFVEGIHNFRDIGSYTSTASTTSTPPQQIKTNLIYRCADPSNVTPAGISTLTSTLHIRTIFDLRSHPEVARGVLGPARPIPGIERFHTPVFPQQDGSPEALALRYKSYAHGGVEGFVKAYDEILTSGGPAFRQVFLHLRDRPGDAILFHCSAGKDRTGVLTALILKLGGVSDEDVADEYALTELGIDPMKKVMVDHLLESDFLKGDREAALRMVESKRESMVATLELIRMKFGGVQRYLEVYCQLSSEDLERIRGNILGERGVGS